MMSIKMSTKTWLGVYNQAKQLKAVASSKFKERESEALNVIDGMVLNACKELFMGQCSQYFTQINKPMLATCLLMQGHLEVDAAASLDKMQKNKRLKAAIVPAAEYNLDKFFHGDNVKDLQRTYEFMVSLYDTVLGRLAEYAKNSEGPIGLAEDDVTRDLAQDFSSFLEPFIAWREFGFDVGFDVEFPPKWLSDLDTVIEVVGNIAVGKLDAVCKSSSPLARE